MKQAIGFIFILLLISTTIALVAFRLIHYHWPWEPDYSKPTVIAEPSVQEKKGALPYLTRMIEPLTIEINGIVISSNDNGYLVLTDKSDLEDFTIEFSENHDTIYLPSNHVKKVCIKHLDATRCADSLLLWDLILKMEETK